MRQVHLGARSRRASTAQYQPYVASSTTSGDSPARAITVDNRSTSLLIRMHSNGSPLGGHPDDHRPPPMQIDSHELLTRIGFAHKGPPSSNGREHPPVSTHLRESHEERRPRSFIASEPVETKRIELSTPALQIRTSLFEGVGLGL